MAEHCILDN